MNCLCKDTTATDHAIMNRRLPKTIGGSLWLHLEGNSATVTVQVTAASVRVSIHDMTIATKIDRVTCRIDQISLKGCYDCDNGAELIITCQTNFSRAIGHVICETTSFHVDCSTSSQIQTIRLHLDHPEINEICQVTCPAVSTTFQMRGTLALVTMTYKSSHQTSIFGTITESSLLPLLRRALLGDFSLMITTFSVILACIVTTFVCRGLLCYRRFI